VPTRTQQRLLGIGPSTGALEIGRPGYAAGGPVEWLHTVIRGDRFSLLAELPVHTGYRVTPDNRVPVDVALAAS
jgi:GntR family transcriptional regulator